MSQRIIAGFVREIFKAADRPLTVVDVYTRLESAGLKLDREKVRHCVVNLYGRKFIESVTTDYKHGSTYQLRNPELVMPAPITKLLQNDTRSEWEKKRYPLPTLTGNVRMVSFGEVA